MSKRIRQILSMIGMIAFATVTLSGCGSKEPAADTTHTAFTPALDTKAAVSLEIAGFMANFESLDQVINDFNEYYPNVSINYEQNSLQSLSDYLEHNDYIDIFMTNDANVRSIDQPELYVFDNCVDLSKEPVTTDAIDPDLLKACTINGQLVRIPIAKTMCGMVVNQTLLEKEGLTLPETYDEFLSVCEALKSKGYTPIQSSKYHACSDMVLPMAMSILGNDKKLTEKVNTDDTSYADALSTVYERLEELLEKGYCSYEVNATYPDDNYDQAILKFFEGDVPFWIATTESFSGMKKRESKSDAFTENPFSYAFVNVPLGDQGVYVYEEPWYGFSVNKQSAHKDYAIEFMNFLSQEDELDKLAEIKGMPSLTIHSDDARFDAVLHPDKLEARYVLDGDMASSVTGTIADTANEFGAGEFSSASEVIESIKHP